MRSDGTGAGGGTLAGRTQGGTTAGAMIGDATTRVTTDAMTTAATTGDMITIMPIGGTTMVTMIGGRMAATTIGGTNGASTTGTTAGGMSLATTPSGANTRARDGMAGGKVTHRVAEVLYFQISGSGYGTRSVVPAYPPACALWLLVWYCTLSAFVGVLASARHALVSTDALYRSGRPVPCTLLQWRVRSRVSDHGHGARAMKPCRHIKSFDVSTQLIYFAPRAPARGGYVPAPTSDLRLCTGSPCPEPEPGGAHHLCSSTS